MSLFKKTGAFLFASRFVLLTEKQSGIRSRFQQVLEHYDSLRPEELRVPEKKFGFHALQLRGNQQ